jgi:hypothetical protein
VTKGFEDMMASITMIRSPFASIKNKKKKKTKTTNLVFAFERGFMFYLGN